MESRFTLGLNAAKNTEGNLGGDAKNLTAYSTSRVKIRKKVYVHEGCILKIEGATGK